MLAVITALIGTVAIAVLVCLIVRDAGRPAR